MKYSQTLIDDEYESSNIASQEPFLVVSILYTINHSRYVHLSATK